MSIGVALIILAVVLTFVWAAIVAVLELQRIAREDRAMEELNARLTNLGWRE
ncbi:MAG TPA: hypothetical protein VN764_06430 [Polyangiaceae bacterium]|nr:hypothetical protein [Polyangiaceae bacterium]